LLCKTAGTAWIVAPSCTQVSRIWVAREDAITCANALTGHSGTWFIPTSAQLQNPGYTCRQYWDTFIFSSYWSSSEFNGTLACRVVFSNGSTFCSPKTSAYYVRAFRCITY
jgi:hypothetical protein